MRDVGGELTRRDFLFGLGRGVGAGLLGFSLVPLLEGCGTNTVVPLGAPVDFPFVSAPADFFVQNGAQASVVNWAMPALDAAGFRLAVSGLVTTPRSFSLAEIQALSPASEAVFLKTLQCVFDPPLLATATGLAGNATWTGIPLQAALDACGVDHARAVRVRFHGADGFGNNVKLARIYGAQPAGLLPPMLVYAMNGQPLLREHGAPLRLVVPETYGFKNVKWLAGVEVTDSDLPFGTYQDHGFFDDGTLAVNSKIISPQRNAQVSAGPLQLSGFALAGAGAVAAVEIQVDGGAWAAADLVPLSEIATSEGLSTAALEQVKRSFGFPFRGVWVKWRHTWNATAGQHTLAVRARDAAGNVQPVSDPNVMDGSNAIVQVPVTVV